MAQKVPASPRCRRAEHIRDILHDLDLLRVPTSTLEETGPSMRKARELRIQELKKANGTLKEGYEKILIDLKEARDRRKILLHYYLKINDVLKDTNDTFPQENADFQVGAEECIRDLNSRKFTILIAGETSAGKSSLINLLLNDRVLPTSIQKNTLTICEISYGAKREAVIYFAKSAKTPLKLKDIKFDTIKQYIEKPKDDEHWCKKIEIKIPNLLLKGGVVIVDSPGIGDSEQVSKIALEYLPQACAFIYVINSSNAGGLQEDRLMLIVKKWKQLYEGNECRGLTGDSALFVCNKWDEVERQTSTFDKEKLQKDNVCKLKKNIPELDEKSQMIKMSVDEATKVHEKFEAINDDLISLINGIQRLLPLCIKKKTEYFYCWISGYLTDLSDQMKAQVKNARRNRDERLKAREEVEVKLEKLKQGTFIRETEEVLSNHIKRVSVLVQSNLQSDDVKRAFCTWEEKDLPQIDDGQSGDIVQLKKIYKKCIEQRLEAFIQKLEKQENIFAKAHADLEKRFHRSFFEFEKDIRDIDRVLVGESMDEFMPFEVSPDKLRPPLDPRVKKFLLLTSVIFMPILFPIGLAAGVLSAPVFGYLAFEKYLKEQHLKNNACQALTELSTEFLKVFVDHEVENRVLQEFTEEKNRISMVKRCHGKLVDKYEKDLVQNEDDAKGQKIVQTLAPLYKKLDVMNENLMFDAIQHGIQVMYPSCQIDKKRLDYTETSDNKLGIGSYGTVYKGKLSCPGHARKDVAVKKMIKPPQPSSVATFLGEAAMLIQLTHKHIVAFYGVVMDVNNHKPSSLALVFQLCSGSLRKHIFEEKMCIPWKTASAASVTCQWSKEILDAMKFIHSKEIVHRDLKLDNVLLLERKNIKRIKIADLGLAKFSNRITETYCGTPLYMAPEVRERKVYDSKADMYSFGLMMWEMWFGKKFPFQLCSPSQDDVYRQMEKDIYFDKAHGVTFNPPPAKWIELMVTCWDFDPCLRKTATECINLIEDI